MGSYIARRILLMIPTLLGILFVSFIVVQFAPGGPVERVIAQLSGADTGGGGFERMRKALRVDSLDLAAGGAGGPTVGASTYLTDKINVGVRAGAKPADAAVNVGLDVAKRLRVQSETRMDGHTSVGVGMEWEY